MTEESPEAKTTGPPSPGPGGSVPGSVENSNNGNAVNIGAICPVVATTTIGESSTILTISSSSSVVVPSSSATGSSTTALGNIGDSSGTSAGGNAVGKNIGNGGPRSPKHPRRSRVKLTEQQLETSTRDELAAKWREQDLYVECLEAQAAAQEGQLSCLRESEEKYRQQCCEVSHRERILVRRLASKEQQLLEYVNQITELRAGQTPSSSALRSALLDSAVNILIQKLRQELLSTKAKLEDTQNELSAWKFTPDSNTGKRLMAKCRLLYQENEELGRMIASGRIAKLEGELALQKSFSEEVKKSQSELDEFLQDLDEDVEGMQSTIYFLQQELRKARESVSLLQQENNSLKSISVSSSSLLSSGIAQPAPSSPSLADNGLSNGLSVLDAFSIKKEESTSETATATATATTTATTTTTTTTTMTTTTTTTTTTIDPVSENTKSITIKSEFDYDSSAPIVTGARTPPPPPPPPPTPPPPPPPPSSSSSSGPTASFDPWSDSTDKNRHPDDADESSNDSAALIIKVENEELSDREDDDDEDEDDDREETVTTTDSCLTRGSHRLSTRLTTSNEKIKNKNETGKSNGDERGTSSRPISRRQLRDRTAKRDKSSADSDDERRLHKKKRRESILSIDYNETDDDALLITNGESIQSDPDDGP